ncbi:hypothetical protein GTO89_06345 [Heliobacterium gestii]|uniref:YqbQ/XkdQ domain-containing protein n=1 Tax=Heliomicrobium gestii TaxID=2699 RepID=A0A845L7G9_HELGE|nr:hypothetical protein [Heliomicrobium gestii]MBM7866010.1 hypothetical protein [Heliomicrobium gestii]MZP42657.1 hypothetical protein [Heliomicrobium gestii]
MDLLEKPRYRINHVLQDGTAFDLTPAVRSVKWSGDIRQAARSLEVSLAFGSDSMQPKHDVPVGSHLFLYSDERELFRGVVFSAQKNTQGNYTLKAYDHLIYLLKSKGTYKFRQMQPEQIIAQLCADYGLIAGDLASTDYMIDKVILREKSIYDMCLIVLTMAMKQNGKKYQIKMKEGALQVVEKGDQVLRWLLTGQANLLSADFGENIDEMRNRVVLMGDKDQVLAEVDDPALIDQYGLLMELKRESNIKPSEARTMAENLLKELGKSSREASLECLGIDDVEAGVAVQVEETLTGLTGVFYVENDEHTLENGCHQMRLKLAWTDEVNTKEADKDDR